MPPTPHTVLPCYNARCYSSTRSAPPSPRAYRPTAPEHGSSRHPPYPEPPAAAEQKKSLISRVWPTKPSQRGPINIGAQDPARGVEAARRVVKEGVLDPRYKSSAGRVTALVIALPLSIYLSYELIQRGFMGKEQKKLVPPPPGRAEDSPKPT